MPFYSIDTSSILNGRRDLLPPSIFPSLWSNVEEMIKLGEIQAVDIVLDELSRRDDDAHTWARLNVGLFVPLEVPTQTATSQLLRDHPKLLGKGGGRNGADPFVIGLAMANLGCVITEEKPTGNIQKPRIPDVCDAVGIPWVNLVKFIAAQNWVF
ncbi:DUF4411 family protein [Streptomyces sp. NPDC091267]|uniref:DUF4411 family protein n=1 Tax=Streptomyces sp. NPDC091267 TaxID=3155195 RepID=UPI003422BC53